MRRRFKLSIIHYLALTGLGLVSTLAMLQINELRWEQRQTQQLMVEMQEHHQQETCALVKQIRIYRDKIQALEQENGALAEMLDLRVQNHRIVTGGLPVQELVPEWFLSRSGRPEQGLLTGINMPLLSRSGFSAGAFEKAWRHYGAAGLLGTGKALVKAEKKYGVNALALAAIIVHESGWGRSSLARQKNNLAGINATNSNPFGNARTFKSKAECIFYLAKMLKQDYLTTGGSFYRGDNLAAVNACYATDPAWASKVALIMGLIARAATEDPEALIARARAV